MDDDTIIEGGCLCGHVRYRIVGPVGPSVYCHCSMCRKSGGGPVSAWISAPKDRVSFRGGTSVVYESSPGTERRFCPKCGSQLTFSSDRYPDDYDITVGTLDDPDAHPPSHHVWTSSGISWLCLDEHIPSHAEFSSGSEEG